MITIKQKGDFKNTERFLKRASKLEISKILKRYGEKGVAALAAATPSDTGNTAGLWNYEVRVTKNTASISWTNSQMAGSVPLVILLQYGHGTGTGGYVQGRDFINPAVRPIFDDILREVWKEVTNL